MNEKAEQEDSSSVPSTNRADDFDRNNSDDDAFNPFAENRDDSHETKSEEKTSKPTTKDVDNSGDPEEEEFNPFIENIDDSSEDNWSGDNSSGDNSSEDNSSGDNSSEDNSSEDNSSEDNSSEDNSSEGNSSEDNSSEDNSSEGNSSEGNSSEDNSSEGNSSEGNSSEDNSSEDNSSEDNSSEVNSSEDDSIEVDSSEVDSSEVDSSEVDSSEVDSSEVDSSEDDSSEDDSSEDDSSEDDSSEDDSSEDDSSEDNSNENTANEDVKEEEYNPFKEESDNPSETQKSGELFNPVNETLNNSHKTDPGTSVSMSGTIPTKTVIFQKTKTNTNAVRLTTAATILTREYGESLNAVTSTLPRQKVTKKYSTTPSIIKAQTPSVNLQNTKHTTSTQKIINILKTKNIEVYNTFPVNEKVQQPITIGSDGNKPSPTTTMVTEPYTFSSNGQKSTADYKDIRPTPFVNGNNLRKVINAYLSATAARNSPTTTRNTMTPTSNSSLKSSLKKTLVDKLSNLMKSQKPTTNSYKDMVADITPTEQIIKLAKTLSDKKFKELLPKITYSVNLDLINTTTLPIIIKTDITSKPSATSQITTNRLRNPGTKRSNNMKQRGVINNNKIVSNELPSKNNVASVEYSDIANTAVPTETVIRLNDILRSTVTPHAKVQTYTSHQLKTTKSPLNYKTEPRFVMKEVDDEIRRIGDAINKMSRITTTSPERKEGIFIRSDYVTQSSSTIDKSSDFLNGETTIQSTSTETSPLVDVVETSPLVVDSTKVPKRTV